MSRPRRKPPNTFAFAGPNIIADVAGFAELAEASRAIDDAAASELALDLSSISYIETHMLAALIAVVRRSLLEGAKVKLQNPAPAIADELLSGIENRSPVSRARSFDLKDEVQFSQHAAKALLEMEALCITPALERKILETLDEVFANSAMHSISQAGVSFSVMYHANRSLICFLIADTGRGIPGSTQNARLKFASDEFAIDWAMAPNNTTKPRNIPGGVGSTVLRDFIDANGGRLAVVSRNGFWEQADGYVRKFPLQHAYPGTAVVIEVLTTDKRAYDSSLDFDPNDMW